MNKNKQEMLERNDEKGELSVSELNALDAETRRMYLESAAAAYHSGHQGKDIEGFERVRDRFRELRPAVVGSFEQDVNVVRDMEPSRSLDKMDREELGAEYLRLSRDYSRNKARLDEISRRLEG
jgi:hypothetical protein